VERIRLENLTKIYDRHPVVADFSLSVSAGDFCVILGPSGSGKSSVMNMIGGFTAPTSGEIYIDGEPATGIPPHARDLGMMFQGYALFPHLTVFENVAFPLRARGVRSGELRARVERTLEVVELSDLQGRRPNELSGGQQQRTALARALVFGPRVLLMDEPLAALDRRLRERMQLEIKAIQRQLAITVLYITHDQQEAMMLADMLVVMNQGRAEQVGAPLSVYHRPRTRFVCDFLGDSNIFDATVESIAPGAIVCRAHSGERIIVTAEQPIANGPNRHCFPGQQGAGKCRNGHRCASSFGRKGHDRFQWSDHIGLSHDRSDVAASRRASRVRRNHRQIDYGCERTGRRYAGPDDGT